MKPSQTQWYCEYQKSVAAMELRGLPVAYDEYQEIRRHRPAILDGLIGTVNQVTPVFVERKFKKHPMLRWCRGVGILWPVKPSETTGKPYQPFDDETLKEMESRHPFIAAVRQVKKTMERFKEQSFAVDPSTHRHYFSTNTFGAITGRNGMKGFIFNGPKWLRFLIVPESPGHVLVYFDFEAQEIGIAAALSGDPEMWAMYQAGDPHMAFAIRAGAAPVHATKETHGAVRRKYKSINLGVIYVQSEYGIAIKLGISIREARAILDDHRRLFPRFWQWSERMVQSAFDRGYISTPCGWRCIVPPTSNERTWMNWPMQAVGGDIMRLVMIYLYRQNVQVLAVIHDGFVATCRRDQIADLRDAFDYACNTACEHVLPGFSLRVGSTEFEDRFEDEDGLEMWQRIQTILAGVRNAN